MSKRWNKNPFHTNYDSFCNSQATKVDYNKLDHLKYNALFWRLLLSYFCHPWLQILNTVLVGPFRLEHKYKIEYGYDFSNKLITWFHTTFVPIIVLFNCSATGTSEGSGIITGLKFASPSHTRCGDPVA